MNIKSEANAWRQRGYDDGFAGRVARTPLRADPAIGQAYLVGYRRGDEARKAATA